MTKAATAQLLDREARVRSLTGVLRSPQSAFYVPTVVISVVRVVQANVKNRLIATLWMEKNYLSLRSGRDRILPIRHCAL